MKKQKPILLIDQDDVMAEYIARLVEEFNDKYKTSFKKTDCTRWDLISIFGEEIKTVMHQPELFKSLEPVPGAIETFKRLYTSGWFEMYIVTASHPAVVEAKVEWLEEHMPFFPTNQMIVCSQKQMIKGDYLLDDGMHNIEAFQKAGGTSIVFDRPHNNQESTSDYVRVSNWRDFENYIIEACYPEKANDYFEKLAEKAV